ncbi:Minf_1886 family protein [Roseibacillus ishigakijimensis]|uniref:Verruc_Plancto-restricted protein n=1 Tax=Roseibacillus ishigakijimensis TaxID=454146 RepID=A0A934VNV3_9BACT|nr:Minf_1886 family protein [Roseibacillus ishigakijimensis]MBK1835430.1 hypothetical protein [Roseibacillus ishigakijimensis]
MHASAFQEAIATICQRDSRFDPDAYYFLKEALDFTVKRSKEGDENANRHVTGPELLVGFRDFALDQFGPMAATLLREWGVRRCQHVGDMVFNLINEQVFGKQDSDSPEDFSDLFTFEEAFVLPFLPAEDARRPAA